MRVDRTARRIVVAEPGERVAAIAVDDDVGLGEALLEHGSICVVAQVEPSASLAEVHFGGDAGFAPHGRVDPQHVGPETGEQPRGDGPGEHAGQVEDAHPMQRTINGPNRGHSCCLLLSDAVLLAMHQRLSGQDLTLRVRGPLRSAAKRRGHSPSFDDCGLEFERVPCGDGDSDRLALFLGLQYLECRGLVVRSVRVQPHESVAARIDPGDRIPDGRQLPALRLDGEAEPQ